VAIAPGVPYLGPSQPHWAASAATWADVVPDPSGWQLFNRHAITHDHRRWVEFFFAEQLVEPHSTKQLEDAVAWAPESTGEILAASEEAQELAAPNRLRFEQQCRGIAVPTLVVHGDQDVCQHVDKGRAFAELVGAELVVLEGAGHLALVRDTFRRSRTRPVGYSSDNRAASWPSDPIRRVASRASTRDVPLRWGATAVRYPAQRLRE
jgi:pimeloyl-ACP methyl ester carboxylesterase